MDKQFKIADVRFNNGTLTIDSTACSPTYKHYNVHVVTEGDTIIVSGEESHYGYSLYKGEFNVKEITENSIELYRAWPWSKKLKKRSLQVVEFLKRNNVTYISTNYILIEEKC